MLFLNILVLIDYCYLVYQLVLGLHSRFTEEGTSCNTVTEITFGQRKCHRPMTLAAIVTRQNCKHIDRISTSFFDKYFIVAVVTVQLFIMRTMRK